MAQRAGYAMRIAEDAHRCGGCGDTVDQGDEYGHPGPTSEIQVICLGCIEAILEEENDMGGHTHAKAAQRVRGAFICGDNVAYFQFCRCGAERRICHCTQCEDQGSNVGRWTIPKKRPAITWFCSSDQEGCADAIPTRDATEYWDVVTQTWTINDPFLSNDSRPYCPNCGSQLDMRELTPGDLFNLEEE